MVHYLKFVTYYYCMTENLQRSNTYTNRLYRTYVCTHCVAYTLVFCSTLNCSLMDCCFEIIMATATKIDIKNDSTEHAQNTKNCGAAHPIPSENYVQKLYILCTSYLVCYYGFLRGLVFKKTITIIDFDIFDFVSSIYGYTIFLCISLLLNSE